MELLPFRQEALFAQRALFLKKAYHAAGNMVEIDKNIKTGFFIQLKQPDGKACFIINDSEEKESVEETISRDRKYLVEEKNRKHRY